MPLAFFRHALSAARASARASTPWLGLAAGWGTKSPGPLNVRLLGSCQRRARQQRFRAGFFEAVWRRGRRWEAAADPSVIEV